MLSQNTKYFPHSFLLCSVVIVYIHDHFLDLTLKVCTSFSLLFYCLIIVLTGWHAWGHETASTGRYAHTEIHSGRCRLNEGLAVVFSVLLFINLSNMIKDCQQEWQREKEREEMEKRQLPSFFSQIGLFKNNTDNTVSGFLLHLESLFFFFTHTVPSNT